MKLFEVQVWVKYADSVMWEVFREDGKDLLITSFDGPCTAARKAERLIRALAKKKHHRLCGLRIESIKLIGIIDA